MPPTTRFATLADATKAALGGPNDGKLGGVCGLSPRHSGVPAVHYPDPLSVHKDGAAPEIVAGTTEYVTNGKRREPNCTVPNASVPSGKPKLCADCGRFPADPPSRYCPGCEAYREHQR